MELREIKSFVALARSHSILEAARELQLTSGAVHKHLKILERELGVRLYERQDGELRLTAAGEVAFPHFVDVLDRRDAAIRAIADCKEETGGLIRVGAGPNFSSRMLPKILSKFRHAYPKVEVFVETGDARQLLLALRNGDLDIIFELEYPDMKPPEFTPLAQWQAHLGIISAPSDLPSHCPMERLAKEPFILFRKGSRMQDMIDAYFQRLPFQPQVVMRSDSADAVKAMVKSRLGIAMLFLYNVSQEFKSGSLRIIHTDAPPLSARMVLLKRSSRHTSRALSAFAKVAQSMNWTSLHPLPLEQASTEP